ncbi:fimbria/pilus periplasmic chaperone [Acinetobacter pittii]|uniref:fimbrial biogenesis chaperone n=1 Tax=Acinetobacter pittii TaxID=48296 RepID=UPI002A6B091E|nr:fimbria/pilus periplasmic chaperone [Acinetobacter pittii]WPP68912.1 fimbria/pilus periplasmic chaperone [Acinetobacter pittii]
MFFNTLTLKNTLQGSSVFLSAVLIASPVFAQATFLIWPIYPKIESQEKATAIWLQNTGKSDAMIQVRVFEWTQELYKDQYAEQNKIIPSPPVAKIKAGEKHMLRLTKAENATDGKEQAYRIIVDELPIKLSEDEAKTASKVNFQMRYSIPLFVYGKEIGSGLNELSQKLNEKNPSAKPILTWWVNKNPQGKAELFIKNSGQKFTRLSGIKLKPEATQVAFDNASFGYVLAQSTMKFEIDIKHFDSIKQRHVLYAVDSSGSKSQVIEMKLDEARQ